MRTKSAWLVQIETIILILYTSKNCLKSIFAGYFLCAGSGRNDHCSGSS